MAFSARLTHDVANLAQGHIIAFDEVITNLGNTYSAQTGEFTCFHAGVYVFYVNILAQGPKEITTRLIKNGVQILMHTYSGDKDYFSSGSNMVTTQLEVGDSVGVVLHYFQTGYIIDYYYSTFSGFLL